MMTSSLFGMVGPFEMIIGLLLYCLPIVALVWFLKTVASMAASLREISARLQTLERTIRDTAVGELPRR